MEHVTIVLCLVESGAAVVMVFGEQIKRICFADINRKSRMRLDWTVSGLRMRNHLRGFVETVCLSSSTLTSNLRVRAERPAHRAF